MIFVEPETFHGTSLLAYAPVAHTARKRKRRADRTPLFFAKAYAPWAYGLFFARLCPVGIRLNGLTLLLWPWFIVMDMVNVNDVLGLTTSPLFKGEGEQCCH